MWQLLRSFWQVIWRQLRLGRLWPRFGGRPSKELGYGGANPEPDPMTIPQRAAIMWWKRLGYMVGSIALYLLAVDFNLLWLFGSSPSIQKLQSPKLELASSIITSDGVLVGKYFKKNRSPIEYDKISPLLIKTLLATEDIRFYDHSGVDPAALVGIAVSAIKGDGRGGSTLTQQLAKNLYKTRSLSSRGLLSYIPLVSTVVTKTKEWITSVKLERAFTKEEILTLYLNTVDFGNNCFGIKTAADYYFATTPARLKAEECALLIGMLKATSNYNPKKNYDRAIKRRNTVLRQMVKYGFLTDHQVDSISEIKIPYPKGEGRQGHPDGVLDYYNQYLTNFLEGWAEEYREETNTDLDIYTSGLKIYLTIDSRMQAHAQAAVAKHMASLQGRFEGHWRGENPWIDEKGVEIPNFLDNMVRRTDAYKILVRRFGKRTDSIQYYLNKPHRIVVFNWKKPSGDTVMMSTMDSLAYYKRLLNTGMMTMDPFTGHIKAWIGGINYNYFKYDHVKQMARQPGSTFKAFVYAAAMDKGYAPCFRIQDNPVTMRYRDTLADGRIVDTSWSPHNATGNFSGINMSLRFGIGRSVNSIAAQMTSLLGNGDPVKGAAVVAEYAKKMGIKGKLKPRPAIGLGSNDVSLFDMVGAYSTFLNKGVHQEPIIVSRIEDHNGNVIKDFRPKQSKALSEEAAWLMVYMLQGTLQEPGGTAQALWSYQVFRNNQLAGKTGTSSNQSDGWFMGMSKDLVTGVWVGAEERSIHFRTLRQGEGSKTALPIYGLFMERLYADRKLGITEGFFPKADVSINRKYQCTTILPRAEVRQDSVSTTPTDPTKDETHPDNIDGAVVE